MAFFSNIFGYVLNFIYSFVNNYGVAIILFSVFIKLILLPLSIKQQKTMKTTEKIQKETKIIQEKYKNDQEKINKEVMDLYKREKMNPLSGCFTALIQLLLILAMFYLVRSPLTFMRKINEEDIDSVAEYIKQEQGEDAVSQAYPQISILKYIVNKEENNEKIEIEGKEDINIDDFYINMKFLGLDLSSIPQNEFKNIKVYIIPVLYVISSIVSTRLTLNKKEEDKREEDKKETKESKEEPDMSAAMGKNMNYIIPIMSVSISLIAPLGLALYWLTNNILMIIERIVITKTVLNKNEEE